MLTKYLEDLFACVIIIDNLISSCKHNFIRYALNQVKINLLCTFDIIYEMEVDENVKR